MERVKTYRQVPEMAAWILVVYLAGFASSIAYPVHQQQPDQSASQEVYESKPIPSLFGEFRTTLASYLFAKAHEYLHGGVILRAATDREVRSHARIASHGDALTDHHGGSQTSVVPEMERDPRGIWGSLERATQPFMDIRNHGHRDLKEALPLFRMMTWSDPHFLEAYSMGAYLIFSASDGKRMAEALEFLREGIANNPRSYLLRGEYGHYQYMNLKNLPLARKYLVEAAELIEQTAESDLDPQRAEDIWNELALVCRRLRDEESELYWARRGLARFPTSMPCRRSLKRLGVALRPDQTPEALLQPQRSQAPDAQGSGARAE
jgi:tetratricopeptide (TPR) repeat protein